MIDACTDPDNCKRCRTMPAWRNGLVHAGRPASEEQKDENDG